MVMKRKKKKRRFFHAFRTKRRNPQINWKINLGVDRNLLLFIFNRHYYESQKIGKIGKLSA